MTPDEKQLIEDFFGRLAAQGGQDKDRAAEALIAQELRRNPEAAYLLVQTALVYEHQMANLEDEVRILRQQLEERDDDRGGQGGSFLGGRLGSRAPARSGGPGYGMPRTGVMDDGDDRDTRRSEQASPWAATSQPSRDDAYARRTPDVPPPAQREQARAQAAQGGGFFRSAMATAAGVAGGLMLGESLKGLFGGDAAHASEAGKDSADHSAEHGKLDEHSDEAFFEDFGGDDGGGMDV